jgi:hypothetical protein
MRRIVLFFVIGALTVVFYFSSSLQHSITEKNLERAPLTTKGAIATLVTNERHDVDNLCTGLQSLVNLADNNSNEAADVLVFHDSLSQHQIQQLQNCTNRLVHFPLLQYSFETSFPKGFDYEREEPNWTKRSKWSYHQMIRFWITQIWQHPAVEHYETLMRLDSDACFEYPLRNDSFYKTLPHLPQGIVYHANEIKFDSAAVSYGFGNFARAYVSKHSLKVQNPALWRAIPSRSRKRAKFPLFYNNFEVSLIQFMKRPDVIQWHEAITEQEPFGVYRYRWGDAIVRYVTMAIFASPDSIVGRKSPKGYNHGGCLDTKGA